MFTWPFSDRARLAAARSLVEHFAPIMNSRVSVQLWDGSVLPLGPNADPDVRFIIHGAGVISSLLRWPSLDNFVRHYAMGRLECAGADLCTFTEMARGEGIKKFRHGLSVWKLAGKALPFLFHRADRSAVRHVIKDSSGREPIKHNYKQMLQFHYDVSNEFYQLFLDPEMVYTCAYFTDWNNTLAQAQVDKLEMVCRKLRLKPGDTLFDAGCGWGALLCHAAKHYGVRGYGATLSAQQVAYCRERIEREGLTGQVTVDCKDVNDVEGQFDKVASIGMMEHVGVRNYATYFQKLHSLLKDRGILVNHGILRGAKRTTKKFFKSRPEHKFIQKYIFPGGELGHIGHVLEMMEQNHFMVHDVEGWREHYVLTCTQWCKNLYANRVKAAELVGEEIVRMWAAYLAGFASTFAKGSTRLFQIVAVKQRAKGGPILPSARNDLYERPFPSEMPETGHAKAA